VDIEPIPDLPALMMKGHQDWVCVADLHIGIEVQLRAAGFNIPSQMPRMLASLEGLASRASRMLILGDIKHRIPSIGYREDKEIRHLLQALLSRFDELVIASGNHDGGLSSILPAEVKAIANHGGKIEDVGFFHGHVWPSKESMASEKLVMAHIHPSILLVDSLGTKTNEKCWLKAKLRSKGVAEKYDACPKELVVVPAFNPLLTGTPINSKAGSYMGPLFRNNLVDENSLTAFLLDGTDLGHPLRR